MDDDSDAGDARRHAERASEESERVSDESPTPASVADWREDGVYEHATLGDVAVDADAVIVVGYDAWTEPVIDALLARGVDVTVVVTEAAHAAALEAADVAVVHTEDVDEACFDAAGLADADAVLVATLDEQLNVLAVLTVMNVTESVEVATFAREQRDVPKLRAAGADVVISLGQVVGELLVEVALTDRSVGDVVAELTERY